MKITSLALLLVSTVCAACAADNRDDDDDGSQPDAASAPPDAAPAAPDAGPCGPECGNHCPTGTATYLTGVVLAPNGVDPVANASVYVPLAPLQSFPEGVACEICGDLISSAAVLTRTAPDGTFRLGPIPTEMSPVPGTTVDVVAQKGRFRRLAHFQIESWCGDNAASDATFTLPGRQEDSDNTIPKIAVVSGSYDSMECVLMNLGIDSDAIDMYAGVPLKSTEHARKLLLTPAILNTYNIVFLNCGINYELELLSEPNIRANLEAYVNAGGRLYVTDQSYDFIEQVPGFASYIDFGAAGAGAAPEPLDAAQLGDDGITTEALVRDPDMVAWLEAVEHRTGDEIIGAGARVHIDHFVGGWAMQLAVAAVANAKTWISGEVSGLGVTGDLPLTTTFDVDSCGRVLYSSYHTLGRPLFPIDFPTYCTSASLSPQERLLEYLILHAADCIVVQ